MVPHLTLFSHLWVHEEGTGRTGKKKRKGRKKEKNKKRRKKNEIIKGMKC
jgi:hypothetical protein